MPAQFPEWPAAETSNPPKARTLQADRLEKRSFSGANAVLVAGPFPAALGPSASKLAPYWRTQTGSLARIAIPGSGFLDSLIPQESLRRSPGIDSISGARCVPVRDGARVPSYVKLAPNGHALNPRYGSPGVTFDTVATYLPSTREFCRAEVSSGWEPAKPCCECGPWRFTCWEFSMPAEAILPYLCKTRDDCAWPGWGD
jgi:hypothetical protein